MSFEDLPDEILLHILDELKDICKTSTQFIYLRQLGRRYNDLVLYYLFVTGRFDFHLYPPRRLGCNKGMCERNSGPSLDTWSICLARYQLMGAVARLDRDPPESRHLSACFRQIKTAISLLDAELAKPSHVALRARLQSDKRFSSFTKCEALTDLASAIVCQSIISYFGETWYFYSQRSGPVNEIWYSAEEYTYIKSGRQMGHRYSTFRYYEQLPCRFWALFAACYIGDLAMFKAFINSRRSRKRQSMLKAVKELHTELLVLAAKNGHADTVRYLLEIRDNTTTENKWWAHLVIRAAIHSGNPTVVNIVLKSLDVETTYLSLAFRSGHVTCLLASSKPARHAVLDVIDRHYSIIPSDVRHEIIRAAYSLGDLRLLQRYRDKNGIARRMELTTCHVHGELHQGHMNCLKATPTNSPTAPMHTLQYGGFPIEVHRLLAQQFLIHNRGDLFLELRSFYGSRLSRDCFSHLALADGMEGLIIEELSRVKGEMAASKGKSKTLHPELGTLPVELAANALRAGPLALLLAAGARPYHTVPNFRIKYQLYVENIEAFEKTKAVLRRFNCPPLVVEC